MVKSLEKGKRFEREIAKFLTKISNVEWKRTPMSGAFSTKEGIKDSRFKGDVFTECDFYKDIVVECKNLANKDLSIADIFNEKSLLWTFIKQVEEEADEKGWILFIKFKRGKVLVVYDVYKVENIDGLNRIVYMISGYNNNTINLAIKLKGNYNLTYKMFVIKT